MGRWFFLMRGTILLVKLLSKISTVIPEPDNLSNQ
jgi:hypothetical protein